MIAGIAVVSLGHSQPGRAARPRRTVREADPHLEPVLQHPAAQLAQLLTDHSPFDRVFFCNSGAEANEAAIKLARKWGKRNRNGAFGIITAEHGFHGRTLATVTATGKEAYTRSFTPLPDGFVQVPFNDMDALERAVDDSTAPSCSSRSRARAASTSPTETYLRDVQRLLPRQEPAVHARRSADGHRPPRARCGASSAGASSRTS